MRRRPDPLIRFGSSLAELGPLRQERVDVAAALLMLAAVVSATQGEVRDALGLRQATTSDLLRRMHARGLVVYVRQGRTVVYGLAPKGERLVRRALRPEERGGQ